MALWDLYVGTFTKEFAAEVEALRAGSGDPWRGNANATGSVLGEDLRYWPQGGRLADGLEHFTFDDATGAAPYLGTAARDLANPQYLAVHPHLPVIYTAEYARPTRFIALAVLPDGQLEPLSVVDSRGQMAAAVAVHPTGNFAYAGHWGDGALTAFRLDGDGAVAEAATIVPGDPGGVSERAHHHEVRVLPSGAGLLVTDVGEFRPSGRLVFVVGEWDAKAHVLAAQDGMPTQIVASVQTGAPEHQGKWRASEMQLHEDGRTLYVGDRNSDCVTILEVDDDGGVEPIGYQPTFDSGPASVRIDPTGNYLLVGNVYSGSLAVFRIKDDRLLELVTEPVPARAPRSMVFLPQRRQ